MRHMLGKAGRLGAVLVCAGTLALAAPASAQAGAQPDNLSVSFADECGYYVKVTVGNTSTAPVEYRLGVEDADPTAFTIAAGATMVHVWPTAHGKDVTVIVGGGARSHEHVEPAECLAPDLDFDGALACQSLVVLVRNEGRAPGPVRITRNGSQVGELLNLAAGASAARVVPMSPGDVINLQRQTGGPDPQWVTVLDGVFESGEACEGLPRVELTDTCTGVHLKTTNTSQAPLVLEFAGLPPSGPDRTEHTVAAGATFEHDFTVPEGASVGASWKQEPSSQLMAATTHRKSANCSGNPGGLPVTGTSITLVAAAGALLAAGGAAIFVLARRRRRIV